MLLAYILMQKAKEHKQLELMHMRKDLRQERLEQTLMLRAMAQLLIHSGPTRRVSRLKLKANILIQKVLTLKLLVILLTVKENLVLLMEIGRTLKVKIRRHPGRVRMQKEFTVMHRELIHMLKGIIQQLMVILTGKIVNMNLQ